MTYRDPCRLNTNVRSSSPAGFLAMRLTTNRDFMVGLLGDKQFLRDCAAQRRMAGDVWQRIVCMHTAGPAYRARQIARKRRGRKH